MCHLTSIAGYLEVNPCYTMYSLVASDDSSLVSMIRGFSCLLHSLVPPPPIVFALPVLVFLLAFLAPLPFSLRFDYILNLEAGSTLLQSHYWTRLVRPDLPRDQQCYLAKYESEVMKRLGVAAVRVRHQCVRNIIPHRYLTCSALRNLQRTCYQSTEPQHFGSLLYLRCSCHK